MLNRIAKDKGVDAEKALRDRLKAHATDKHTQLQLYSIYLNKINNISRVRSCKIFTQALETIKHQFRQVCHNRNSLPDCSVIL